MPLCCPNPNCKSQEIDVDAESSQVFCMACGNLFAGPATDNSVGFVEENKQSEVAGRMLASMPHREQQLVAGQNKVQLFQSYASGCAKAYEIVSKLATELEIPVCAVNKAKKILSSIFNSGEKLSVPIDQLVAVCTFICSLNEGLPHMLMDYSLVLKISAAKLGKTLGLFANYYGFLIPDQSEDSLFLRFIERIQSLEGKNIDVRTFQDIVNTSKKLLLIAKFEGIDQGRVFSGLLSGMFRLACELHGCSINTFHAARLGYISEATINLRLREFSESIFSTVSREQLLTLTEKEIEEVYKTKTGNFLACKWVSGKESSPGSEGSSKDTGLYENSDSNNVVFLLDLTEEEKRRIDVSPYIETDVDAIRKGFAWSETYGGWVDKQKQLEQRKKNADLVDEGEHYLNLLLNESSKK